MVYNVVKVLRIESGAELGDNIYDQWVTVKVKNQSLTLFDMDMLVSLDAVGDYAEIEIGALVTEMESNVCASPLARGNRFCGKVVDVKHENSLYTHIIDIDGLRIHLMDPEELTINTMIRFKARLDVLDVRGSTSGWTNTSSF